VKKRAASMLRLAVVDDAMRVRLDEIRTVLNGKPLRTCR
jgi:hypothetical protein